MSGSPQVPCAAEHASGFGRSGFTPDTQSAVLSSEINPAPSMFVRSARRIPRVIRIPETVFVHEARVFVALRMKDAFERHPNVLPPVAMTKS